MSKHNATNERIKRDYFRYLKEARGRDEATIDRVSKSLDRFEETTGRKDFKLISDNQPVRRRQPSWPLSPAGGRA
jgi:hypothetical protein